MEPQMVEVFKRLKVMVSESNLSLDAVSKSLRGYTTYPHKIFMERMRQHYPELGALDSRQGKTFRYEKKAEGLNGSRMLNTALQSFYDQELLQNQESVIMYPKISTRTLADPHITEETMSQLINEWVGDHSSLSRNITNFRDLVEDELGSTITKDLFDDFRTSQFSRAVLNHLLTYNWSFPAHKPLQVEGRNHIDGLTMKTKYYAARDDNRAYCRDQNKLRLLTGACLHRLILPKSMVVRSKLHVCDIVRARGKDELNLICPKARDGQVALLVLGDISNFTGSFANSWFMLYAIALDLSKSLKFKSSLFSVGGTILYATWAEIIIVYLYLTVGAECHIHELDRYDSLSGGFLGVTANITSGLLCLSLIMMDLTIRLLPRVYHVQSQAGGDDFAFLLVVACGREEDVTSLIKNEMNRSVGQLKEFKVIALDDLPDGLIHEAYFCRKRVTLKKTNSHMILGYEPSFPIHESILPNVSIKRLDKQILAWSQLDRGLLAYEELCPHMMTLTDSFREVFLRKYPRVRPTRSWATRAWPQRGLAAKLLYGFILSEEAYKMTTEVDRVDVGPYYALASLESKLRHLQVNMLIRSFKVMFRGQVQLVYITIDEESLLEVNREVENVSMYPQTELLNRLLNLIK
jgi:hypothetical protein